MKPVLVVPSIESQPKLTFLALLSLLTIAMTILLTGGAGRTSGAVAQLLNEAKVPFLVASRTGAAPSPFKGCLFDFNDKSTYGNPFAQAADIVALYIVVPVTVIDEKCEPVTAFVDFAKEKGVKRFVLLSASNVEPGQRMMGVVQQHLKSLGVDYSVIQPTWYMGRFSPSFLR